MDIKRVSITLRELVQDYFDDSDNTGKVTGYGGKLSIRPEYQREFVYKDKQRDDVVRSVMKGYPLNIIYWSVNKDDSGEVSYEVLDGQQRTISICQYYNGDYSIDYRYFHNLNDDEQEKFLNYTLDVYLCEGTETEKLAWFQIVNIAGEKLTDQELRNAVYVGPWLADAKRKFSARNCLAERIGKDYMTGSSIRQEYLQSVLKWISARDGGQIEDYMAAHQHDINAMELWNYFQSIVTWIEYNFPNKRAIMKGVDWGLLYNDYHDVTLDPQATEERIKALIMDDDVTKKPGIYGYILTGKEKSLSIRAFTPAQKLEAYERQGGICPHCKAKGINKVWELDEMEADHITPWHAGGKTISENCQMLCKEHNREKSGI